MNAVIDFTSKIQDSTTHHVNVLDSIILKTLKRPHFVEKYRTLKEKFCGFIDNHCTHYKNSQNAKYKIRRKSIHFF